DQLLHEALVREEGLVAAVVVVWHRKTIAQGWWEGKAGRGNRVWWGPGEGPKNLLGWRTGPPKNWRYCGVTRKGAKRRPLWPGGSSPHPQKTFRGGLEAARTG
ncbi:hypothetical protein, partial [Treponema sp. J25]|uniref:hypothetical protein n=1 Tax=Treponema sp. J25 TaxID=2094121 RepID=UPI001A9DFEC7